MKNLLKNLFNVDVSDLELFQTYNDGNGLIVKVRLNKPKEYPYCLRCDRKMVLNGTKEKPINHKILADRNIKILYEARRFRCLSCNCTIFEKNPFAIKGFNNSIPLMNQVMIDLHDYRLNYSMIASKNNISTSQVIRYFDSFVVVPKIELPVNLGIDEIHSDMAKRRNSAYLGVLIDNDYFKLVDILTSRSKWELNNYLSTYPKSQREKVKYVTIDMWEPYEEIAHKWLPNAIVAVDPFHVVEHLTKDFTDIRIRIMNRTIKGSKSYYLLKSWHKLLESDKYKLDGKPKYNHIFHESLNYGDLKKMLLELDEELTLAYELKEAYRYFNSHSTFETASKDLDILISMFQKANIKEYEEFIMIMINWKKEIINSFIKSEETGDRLSNAKSEAMNEKIRTHIRISKGISNFLRFRKRMLYCFNDSLFVMLTYKLTSMKRSLKEKLKEEENKKY